MTTLRQVEANRTNAQKSTGPKSATGKVISASNALRHGLTSQPDAQSLTNWLRIILNDPNAQLDPVNTEPRIAMAHRLAEAEARLERVLAAEADYCQNPDPEGQLEKNVSDIENDADMLEECMSRFGADTKGLKLLARLDKFNRKQKHKASVDHVRQMRKLARYRSEAEAKRKLVLKKWVFLPSF